ncbi:MAG: V-type ATP synthase subunit E family protein [Sphaerochaetaceae bacterium]|jgi:vacuolar-type H+-ATPase subunit E/Vma4|nr:V-type ATP synthase subunit E family protein [Sphaerochaetaceae bacterium]MDD3163435.1 V-type ATP synthase subunit E family protein [Sphaerochaetaceae bacterium]MDD4007643.1 V-type ATP synthase subunit E family protein [Sphaerochaetaceae bacterium]MDD4396579.1 V-type ATP synthase subunit E family protein [Sphaerochaetaceae bacterium]
MTNTLLDGILDAARKEAASNLEKARSQAQAIETENLAKIDAALSDEKSKHDSQLRVIQGKYDSAVKAYQRRLSLRQHSALFDEVMDRLGSDIQQIPERADYPELLQKWIIEGILGLGLDEVTVSCGEGDPVDPAMLALCTEQALKRTGRTFKVNLGYTKLLEHGVIISSPDQRVSFNNLISSRLRRYKSEINDIVEGSACRTE